MRHCDSGTVKWHPSGPPAPRVPDLGRSLGPDHYEAAVCLHGLGVVRFRRGDADAASSALHALGEALRIKTAVLGPDHPEIAALRRNIAVVRAHGRLSTRARA
jgi:hypothetical protein